MAATVSQRLKKSWGFAKTAASRVPHRYNNGDTVKERFHKGNQVRCVTCGDWMDPRVAVDHIERKHPHKMGSVTPSDQKGRKTPNRRKQPAGADPEKLADAGQKNAPAKRKSGPAEPRPTPRYEGKNKTNKNGQKPARGGHKMTASTQPIENAHSNPATGLGDGMVELMNRWAMAMPANFKASKREAESMGETFRGIADALRRRGQNMVEVLNINPTCVEPYDDAAKLASQLGDTFMEVANRIESTYRKHIEVVNDPKTPNLNFLDEEGERG